MKIVAGPSGLHRTRIAMKRIILVAFLVAAAAATASADVLRITINDTIQPISDELIGRPIDEAGRIKADAIVTELRTPGGLENSRRSIVEKIFHSPVPVTASVAPSGSRAPAAALA